MRNLTKIAAVAGLCCGAACNIPVQSLGSKYVKSQLISASVGGTVTVTAADYAPLAGASIQIPAGALARDTTITVTVGTPVTLPSNTTPASAAVADFGPEGTTFSKPATLTLPFTLAQNQVLRGVEAVEANGSTTVYPLAALTVGASTVSLAINGFTRFDCFGDNGSADDGGSACVSPNVQTECGCIPDTALCAPFDGGQVCHCPDVPVPNCGITVGPAPCNCQTAVACDGGNACPAGESACPDGTCVLLGADCTTCPKGELLCNGVCQPSGLDCQVNLDAGQGDAGCVAVCPLGATACGAADGCGGTCPCSCSLANDPSGPCDPNGACQAGALCIGGNCFGCSNGDCSGCTTCPSGDYACPDGTCIPIGAMCTAGCPAGETLCNGVCQPSGQPCSGQADAGTCQPPNVLTACGCIPDTALCAPFDGGACVPSCASSCTGVGCTGTCGGSDGCGGSCVETSCGCISDTAECAPLDGGMPTCPGGEYFCGCGTQGSCIPDTTACAIACADAGVCSPPNVMTACGCIPDTAMCAPFDGGTGTSCVRAGEDPSGPCTNGACANGEICLSGNCFGCSCPSGDSACPDGTCVPGGAPCPG